MARRIWDISQPIRSGIPVWPGDTPYEEALTWTIGPDCPVNVRRVTLSTHTGTHADAPLHYDARGNAVGGLDLSRYIGPAQVITVPPGIGTVRPAHLEGRLREGMERVLLHGFTVFPHDIWPSDFAAVAAETIDLLADRGVFLIGADAPSLDPQSSKTMPAHAAVRRHGMGILEGLVLDGVPDGVYELIALPIPLAEADAAPVRAVLREVVP